MSTIVALNDKVGPGPHMRPVADCTNWWAIVTTPQTADSTANLLKPSDISRSGQDLASLANAGTSVKVCLRYVTGQSVSTPPVVQLIGIDGNGVPMVLADADGNDEFTLTADALADKQDAAGHSYTAAYEVDAENCLYVRVGVKTALVGGGTDGETPGPAIMLKTK